jgi:tetratricopeptide (TPR) repeat protein
LREPSMRMSHQLIKLIQNCPENTCHPQLSLILNHSLKTGKEFIQASKSDPAPLTDLRVRIDKSSASMLQINLDALSDAIPEFPNQLIRNMHQPLDHASFRILEYLGLFQNNRIDSLYKRDVLRTLEIDPYEVLASLFVYINVFGAWDDAEAISKEIAEIVPRLSNRSSELFSIIGTAGLVLALRGVSSYEKLFELLVHISDNPLQLFFYGLRWASIEAKRNRNLQAASKLIDQFELHAIDELVTLDKGFEVELVKGMASNFRGLLALRNNDLDLAESQSILATGTLNRSLKLLSIPVPSEQLRYVWMANFNRAQLAIVQGNMDLAISRIRECLGFARKNDPKAVHATLSSLAYCLLKVGKPAEARKYAEEALMLLRHEYDYGVVLQARKVLLLCYLELGLTNNADRIRSSSKYFWRDESWINND